jgi:hypothetical protein
MTDAQNRFLKLLTTQLKNQDPLNPHGQRADDLATGADQHRRWHRETQCHAAEAGCQQVDGEACRRQPWSAIR